MTKLELKYINKAISRTQEIMDFGRFICPVSALDESLYVYGIDKSKKKILDMFKKHLEHGSIHDFSIQEKEN